jgi:hypothetical protein
VHCSSSLVEKGMGVPCLSLLTDTEWLVVLYCTVLRRLVCSRFDSLPVVYKRECALYTLVSKRERRECGVLTHAHDLLST